MGQSLKLCTGKKYSWSWSNRIISYYSNNFKLNRKYIMHMQIKLPTKQRTYSKQTCCLEKITSEIHQFHKHNQCFIKCLSWLNLCTHIAIYWHVARCHSPNVVYLTLVLLVFCVVVVSMLLSGGQKSEMVDGLQITNFVCFRI